MEFEKEIKQTKPFKSEQVKAMLNTLYTANCLYEKQIKLLKPFGINDQHFNVLRILKGRGTELVTPGEVKEVLINSRGDLTRLVDKLVKMELVSRTHGVVDRRRVELAITPKGLRITVEIQEEFDKEGWYNFQLTNNEAKQLNFLLDKLRGM